MASPDPGYGLTVKIKGGPILEWQPLAGFYRTANDANPFISASSGALPPFDGTTFVIEFDYTDSNQQVLSIYFAYNPATGIFLQKAVESTNDSSEFFTTEQVLAPAWRSGSMVSAGDPDLPIMTRSDAGRGSSSRS